MDREEINALLLERLSWVLSQREPIATEDDLNNLMQGGLSRDEAMGIFLMTAMDLDMEEMEAREIYHRYLPRMLREMTPETVNRDPYVQAMSGLSGEMEGRILTEDAIAAGEIFLRGDMQVDRDGRVLPPVGYSLSEIRYPAMGDEDGSWMSCEPFEIATLRPKAEEAGGKVVSLGLGLGYYAFHALLNPNVTEVICVERDEGIIRLFENHLLPRFPRRERLSILHMDAFDYVRERLGEDRPDTVMVDLWRDAGDGTELYERMKALETAGPRWQYWIEDMIRYYRSAGA